MRWLWVGLFDDIINFGKIFSLIIFRGFRFSLSLLGSGFNLVENIFLESLLNLLLVSLFISHVRLFGFLA